MTTSADTPSSNTNRSTHPSRRQFVLAAAGAAGLAGLTAADTVFARPRPSSNRHGRPWMHRGATILFQGDSITDAGRNRDLTSEPDSQPAMGDGYAWLAAAQVLVDRPNAELKFYNRGISGNKVYQLAERWQADCLDLKPDVLSILIGVNDYWHKHNGQYDGTLEVYETDYRALVNRTKEALPHVKLVICEPFVLKMGAVDDSWFPDFEGYPAAARRVADEAGAVFVPFQSMLNRAAKIAPPEFWLRDGVHPTAAGATLMAHQWLRSVRGAGHHGSRSHGKHRRRRQRR
jgi:lysophospholipase L1-like esterase